MEAALRTAFHMITGRNPEHVDFRATRGLEGVKEGTVTIGDAEVRFAVAHGLGNVETVLNRVREARDSGSEPPYHFIEVMACPGGCVGGGGQPYGVTDKLRSKRAAGLYTEDQAGLWRCSHDNPYISLLYSDFLGEPGGEVSERLLHTSYRPRATYKR
jgi:iron only hydrogenase large subunit-like protein